MRYRTAKRARQEKQYREIIVPVIFERDDWTCQRCGKAGEQCHHVQGREGLRLLDIKHIILLCAECHSWAEAHPRTSRDELESMLAYRYEFAE